MRFLTPVEKRHQQPKLIGKKVINAGSSVNLVFLAKIKQKRSVSS